MNALAQRLAEPAALPALVRIVEDDETPVLVLDESAPFDDLRAAIRDELTPDAFPADGRNPWHGRAVRLDLADREFSLFDLRRLVNMLREEFGVVVAGLCCTQRAFQRYAEAELKMRIYLRPSAAELALKEGAGRSAPPRGEAGPNNRGATVGPQASLSEAVLEIDRPEPTSAEGGRRLLTLDHTLRSGASVRFPGDVVVYGDVNAGAHIEAGGSIIILGALRGLAHAGCPADESAVIIGFDLRPTQLRIGRKIGYPPERPKAEGGGLLSMLRGSSAAQRPAFSPEIASVREGSIVLEEFRGRSNT